MRLQQLMPGAPPAAGELEITGLAYDNRAVGPGALFFCVPGFTRDGHEFAPDAIAHGAVALVVERPLNLDVPEVMVPSVRAAMAPAAAAFYGDPTATLETVGVTGTNGKTTTAFLVRALLEADGRQTGLLGTVKSVIGGVERPVERTTPEAIDLQRTFREMLEGGDVACAMEVSSHALELHRADAIHFAAAIFTNLTQDHLDFHGTMEDYFLAKRRLFAECQPGHAVINVDDPYGARLAAETPGALTFAVRRDATYRASAVETGLAGSRFTVHGPDGVAAAELAAARALQRLQRARRARGRARRSGCRSTWSPRRSRPRGTSRGGSSPSTPARTSRCSSTTRTRRIRSRTCCGPPAASSTTRALRAGAAASTSCSGAGATATAASGR